MIDIISTNILEKSEVIRNLIQRIYSDNVAQGVASLLSVPKIRVQFYPEQYKA